jgi:hypothetical protein
LVWEFNEYCIDNNIFPIVYNVKSFSGEYSGLTYPNAKLIDMFGFQAGLKEMRKKGKWIIEL